MTFSIISSNKTKSAGHAWYASGDAELKSLAVRNKYSAFNGKTHLKAVIDVKDEVIDLTGFIWCPRPKNFFENSREGLGHEVNGPGTVLKFDFYKQRNFTEKDARNLHADLKSKFPHLKLNVVLIHHQPICLVHIGL